MNATFDAHDTVSLLLVFDGFDGMGAGAGVDMRTLKAQFRSVANVDNYAVVGALGVAATIIALMDKVIPVDARTFEMGQLRAAWDFVGAQPLAER
jgi:hypothetical protein